MLYTLALILLVLWILGMLSGYVMGGYVHLLLAAALIIAFVNLISGRKRPA